jgi:hypothetical protein
MKSTLWENYKRMHDAKDEKEYAYFARVAWLGMNALMHHCPETANEEFIKMFEEIRKMKVLDSLSEKDRTVYVNVYTNTLDFYLRQAFSKVMVEIAKIAEPKVQFKQEYYEMSKFYRLPHEIESRLFKTGG